MPKQQSIANWSQVAKTVSNAGLNKQKKIIQNLRKINYRNALNEQIEEHATMSKKQRMFKEKERQKIGKEIEQEKKQEYGKKVDKVKTQQLYQLDNLDLIKLNKSIVSKKGEEGDPAVNQFFKLQDREKLRKLQTRRNFQLQNLLNSKQVEMKNRSKSKEKEAKLYQKEMYDSYIEGEYFKQQSDRELWKNKYLYDKSIRELGDNKNYGYAYQSFLRKQMDERRNKLKSENERMDERLKSLNQTVETVTPSPAYLGLVESFDRRKQMSAIDRHLHFEPSSVLQQEYSRRQSLSPEPARPQKIESSLPQIRPQKEPDRYNERKSESQQQRKQKQFTSYDFISGTHKTFFM